jgi:hypothetical protein
MEEVLEKMNPLRVSHGTKRSLMGFHVAKLIRRVEQFPSSNS